VILPFIACLALRAGFGNQHLVNQFAPPRKQPSQILMSGARHNFPYLAFLPQEQIFCFQSAAA
jgi:hypothetical protein